MRKIYRLRTMGDLRAAAPDATRDKKPQVHFKRLQDETLWQELFFGEGAEAQRLLLNELADEGGPALATNPLRTHQNRYIILCSAVSRGAVQCGMPPLAAETLSAAMIREAERCESTEAVEGMLLKMITRFRQEAREKDNKDVSYLIYKVNNYIEMHFNQYIPVKDISNYIGLNPSYLCTVYKKETGLTILQYIQKRKIEAAKRYLCFSNYSCVEISNILGFSSNSYFIKVFKREAGLTPIQFKKQFKLL